MSATVRATGVVARRGDRDVLRGVDLVVDEGEVVVVLGPNGAGKSTLLHVLGGVHPKAGGSVDVTGRVATVLQAPDLAARSVRANVELALAWWGVPRAERSARANAALDAIAAGHLADRRATALSGGERRRVHLARGFAVQPDVLLLDEPFAGLDVAARDALLRDAAGALRSSCRAAVVVVHDRAEAFAVADRVVVLLDGQIAASGSPQELLDAPPTAAVAAFLGYTGRVEAGDDVLLIRPANVELLDADEAGALSVTVVHRTPQEDAVLLELRSPAAELSARCAYPGPAVGDEVHVGVTGGVRFPTASGRS